MKLLIFPKRSYLVTDIKKPFHATEGTVSVKQLQQEDGSTITTTGEKSGTIISANFVDTLERLPRNAQIMLPKDLSWIISQTGLDKTSTIVEAGSGSGGSGIFLSRYAKKVYSYDIRADHLKHAVKNAKQFGSTNIEFTEGDISQGIKQKNVDVVLLDLPEPWSAITVAAEALKVGGFCITYSPSITQSQQTVVAASHTALKQIKTVEIIEREWQIDAKRCRPAHGALGHTAFLTLFRKLEQ